MYNECEFVIAYYDEKDVVLVANAILVKLRSCLTTGPARTA